MITSQTHNHPFQITPPPASEAPTEDTVDKEGDRSQDTVVREEDTVDPAAEAVDQPRDTVDGSKDTVDQAVPIDEEQPSQRVYTFPWEHEDEEDEEEEGEKEEKRYDR